jgi:hypothetical protein
MVTRQLASIPLRSGHFSTELWKSLWISRLKTQKAQARQQFVQIAHCSGRRNQQARPGMQAFVDKPLTGSCSDDVKISLRPRKLNLEAVA